MRPPLLRRGMISECTGQEGTRRKNRRVLGAAFLLAGIGAIACTGEISGSLGGPGGPGGGTAGTGPITNPIELDPEVIALAKQYGLEKGTGFSKVPTLTSEEYLSTVKKAFGVDTLPGVVLPGDGTDGIFINNGAEISSDYEGYVNAALTIAEALAPAVAASCDFKTQTANCSESELRSKLNVLFRTEMSNADFESFIALLNSELADGRPLNNAIATVIAAALLDERFLFKIEVSLDTAVDAPQSSRLSGLQLANRLAYLLMGTPPDEELLAQADNLGDDVVLRGQIDRLLALTSAEAAVWRFASGWLSVPQKSLAEAGDITHDMLEESKRFSVATILGADGKVEDFLASKESFVSTKLATHYGVTAPGTEWEKVSFAEDSERIGILTHGSFLKYNGRPGDVDVSRIFRGKAVYEHFLCQHLPGPPEDILTEIANGTVASNRLEQPRCLGCHTRIDPIGFLFDRYGGSGELQDMTPPEGNVNANSDIDGDYSSVKQLSEAMANSESYRQCFAKMWFQFSMGRKAYQADAQSFDAIYKELDTTRSPKELLIALLMSEAFRTVNTDSNTTCTERTL